MIIVVAQTAAVLELKAEATNPEANLTTSGDAVSWVFVTITAVGYGDYYPTTLSGRVLGVFVMLSGIALIGVVSSLLANFFLSPPKKRPAEVAEAPDEPKARLARLEAMLEKHAKANTALLEEVAEVRRLVG